MNHMILPRIIGTFRQRSRCRSVCQRRRVEFSSASSAKREDDGITVLYERDESRNNLPRTSFLVSSGNLLYWVWYVFDFVPAVNTSSVPDLHIDPAYGFGGLGLSVLIHSVFTLYPMSLISKIAYKSGVSALTSSPSKQQNQVLVWKHTMPMVYPSKNPVVLALGDIAMDKTAPDTTRILNEYNGDLKKYTGHLGIWNGGFFPLLMEIQKPTEVEQSQLLLEVLLDPDGLKQSQPKSDERNLKFKGKNGRKGGVRRGKRR